MATASDPPPPGPWVGHKGRVYEAVGGEAPREGRFSSVYAAVARGLPSGRSVVPEGARVAVKVYRGTDEGTLRAFRREARVQVELSKATGTPPCPLIYDRMGTDDAPALAMEWCPTDLELWWAVHGIEPDGFVSLCRALADACRQASDCARVIGDNPEVALTLAHIKPRSILRSADGRWLLTSFCDAPTAAPAEGPSETVLLGDEENYKSPEALFEATTRLPAASATWAVGCTLFALLRMRGFLVAGTPMPTSGTESNHFRSHRVALVADLRARKPNLFRGRDLDPRQFLYPERLPDQDRRVISDSLGGVFGEAQDALEGQLAREVARVLDRALSIDPVRRYGDPLEMAADFELLARRYREIREELRTARTEDARPSDHETQIMEIGPPPEITRPDEPETPDPDTMRAETVAAQPEPVTVVSQPVPAPAPGPDPRVAALEAQVARLSREVARLPDPRPRTAWWVAGAIVLLAAFQVVQVGGLAFTWWQSRTGEPVAAVPAPPPPAPAAAPAEAPAEEDEAVAALAAETAAEESPPEAEPPSAPPPEPPPTAAGSTAKTSTKTSSSSKKAATGAPPPPPPDPPPAAASGTASFSVHGGTGWLVGSSGRVGPGAIPAGDYEVFAAPTGAQPASIGRHTIAGGAKVVVRCGFGMCKVAM